MSTPSSAEVYTQGFGSKPLIGTINAIVNPGTTFNPLWKVGQEWINTSTNAIYILTNISTSGGVTTPTWTLLESGTSAFLSLTGDTGTAVPTAGNIKLAGTANQISTSASGSTVTFALTGPYSPSTYTAHGVLIGEGTSSIAATSAGSAGQLLTSGGASADPTWTTATFPATAGATGTILRSNGTNWVASTDTYPDTVTAGSILLGTASNVIGSLADVAVGQVLASGGIGVVPAYTASPSVTGNVTAATGFVATVAGAGLTLNSPAQSGVASGPVIVNGRSGQATFTTVSIAAAADLTLTITNSAITGSSTQVVYSMSGATTGAALCIKSVTNTAGSSAIVVTNGTGATTSTADIVMTFIVLN